MEACLRESIILLCKIGTTCTRHILNSDPSNQNLVKLHECTQNVAEAVNKFGCWAEITNTLISIPGYNNMTRNQKLTTILKMTNVFDDNSVNILLKTVEGNPELIETLDVIMQSVDRVYKNLTNIS